MQTTFELFLRDNEASCIFFTMPMAMITNLPVKGFRSKRRILLIVSGSERTDSFRVLLTALPILVTLYIQFEILSMTLVDYIKFRLPAFTELNIFSSVWC